MLYRRPVRISYTESVAKVEKKKSEKKNAKISRKSREFKQRTRSLVLEEDDPYYVNQNLDDSQRKVYFTCANANRVARRVYDQRDISRELMIEAFKELERVVKAHNELVRYHSIQNYDSASQVGYMKVVELY